MRMPAWSVVMGVLISAVVSAQSDSDYQTWMKTIATSNGSVQKNIAAKNSAGIVTDAQKLQDTFKDVEAFWEKRKAADAVTFAKQAQSAAAAISKSAASGNMEQATADAKELAATCAGCHAAHRERADGGFKIK
jgi:hypothetical protein